mgnify:CR=1 FL=1
MSADQPLIESRVDLSAVRVVMVQQLWRQPELSDVEAATMAALERTGALERITSGDEIAINPANSRVYIAQDAVFLNVPDKLLIYDGASLGQARQDDPTDAGRCSGDDRDFPGEIEGHATCPSLSIEAAMPPSATSVACLSRGGARTRHQRSRLREGVT